MFDRRYRLREPFVKQERKISKSLKKEAIQTRNRKLTIKNKRKRPCAASLVDSSNGASFILPEMFKQAGSTGFDSGHLSTYQEQMKPYHLSLGHAYSANPASVYAGHNGFHSSFTNSRFAPNINIVGAFA